MGSNITEIGNKRYISAGTLSIQTPPDQIKYHRYSLPVSLGRAEQDDIAARLVEQANEYGQWVGISWRQFHSQVVNDSIKASAELPTPGCLSLLARAFLPQSILASLGYEFNQYGEAVNPVEEQAKKEIGSVLIKPYLDRDPMAVRRTSIEVDGMKIDGLLDIVEIETDHVIMPTSALVERLRNIQI